MIKIDKSGLNECTLLSNAFIDYYLPEAEGEYVKVYIFLLRHSNSPDLEISSICEALDLSDRKIKNALNYWSDEELIKLYYTDNKLTGISFIPPAKASKHRKSHLSSDRVRKLLREDEVSQRIKFLGESYFGRPLAPREVSMLLFFHDKLGFNEELCDYLLDYSVMHGAKNMNYANAVALSWHSEGIKSAEEAKAKTAMRSDASADSKPVKTSTKSTGENETVETSVRPKGAAKNSFLDFDQHNYDLKELARRAKED